MGGTVYTFVLSNGLMLEGTIEKESDDEIIIHRWNGHSSIGTRLMKAHVCCISPGGIPRAASDKCEKAQMVMLGANGAYKIDL